MGSQDMSWQDDVRERRKKVLESAQKREQQDNKQREIIQGVWNKLLEANSKLEKDIKLPVRNAKEDAHPPRNIEAMCSENSYCLYNNNNWYIRYGKTYFKENELYVSPVRQKGLTFSADYGELEIGSLDHEDENEVEHFIKYKYDEKTENVLLKNLCMFKPIQSQLKILRKYRSDIYGEKKEGCFIATAACGTVYAKDVIILSHFRDTLLEKYLLGKCFINFYYRFSPPIAKLIENNNFVKSIIRKNFIHPIAEICKIFIKHK